MSQEVELFGIVAGQHPSGEPVIEQVEGIPTGEEKTYKLVKSPAFAKGIAAGDTIKVADNPPGRFDLVERGGNLAITVLSKDHIDEISELLVPEMEKLGATVDVTSARLLVLTIHVSIGFKEIEAVMNRWVDGEMGVWQYGNVYGGEDGQTPLSWWEDSAFTE